MPFLKKSTRYLFPIVVLVCFSACVTRKVCTLPRESADTLPGSSNELDVAIYLDATLSMKGFLVPGTTTYFQQLLPLIETTVSTGWPGGQATFYKFGTKINELHNRDHLAAA